MTRRFDRSIDAVRSTTVGVVRTPEGLRLTLARRIDAPPAVVWALLVDSRVGKRTKHARSERCRAVFEIPIPTAPYAVVCLRALSHLDRLAHEGHENDGPGGAHSTSRETR